MLESVRQRELPVYYLRFAGVVLTVIVVAYIFHQLQEIHTNVHNKMSSLDRVYIANHIAKFEKGLKLVTDGTTAAAAHLDEHKVCLQVLDQPTVSTCC